MILGEQRRGGQGYLEKTLLLAQENDVLELDEVWSFVLKKTNRVWIWLALSRRTRQIVAWWYGPRDKRACRKLWERIPGERISASYKTGICFTDVFAAYSEVLPDDQHRSCAKREGETNHIERFNLTLRQWVARLVRKSLSFSKKTRYHVRAIRHFLIYYYKLKAKQYRLTLAKQLSNSSY